MRELETRPSGPKHSFERRRRPLWPGGPLVSLVGFGGARLGIDSPKTFSESFEALKHAIGLGCNLIDSSAFARDSQSEILVGKVLQHVFSEGIVTRDDLVLVGKVGQISGHLFEQVLSSEMQGLSGRAQLSGPSTFQTGPQKAISFSGSHIRSQVQLTLSRLKVDALNCVLFEYPETFFDIETSPQPLKGQDLRKLFHELLCEAFHELGECVRAGLIQSFGVSSGTLGYPVQVKGSVSLRELLNAATDTGTRSFFRVVSLPLNWIELTPLVAGQDSEQKCLMEEIAQEQLGFLVQRPLNALNRGRLLRLARPRFSDEQVQKMSMAEQKGLENWINLSLDLEKMGRKIIDTAGFEDASLSQMVIATLTSLPQVSAVLLGMRQKMYVEDALEALTRPKLLNGIDLLHEIHSQLEFENS